MSAVVVARSPSLMVPFVFFLFLAILFYMNQATYWQTSLPLQGQQVGVSTIKLSVLHGLCTTEYPTSRQTE